MRQGVRVVARWGFSVLMWQYPLMVFMLTVTGVWAALQIFDTHPNNRFDAILTSVLGGTFALAVIVLLTGTRDWTARNLGLLGVLSGQMLLWIMTTGVRQDWWQVVPDEVLNLIRAVSIVGAPLLVYSLLQWSGERVMTILPIRVTRVVRPVERLEDAADRSEDVADQLERVGEQQGVRQAQQDARGVAQDVRHVAQDVRQAEQDEVHRRNGDR